MSITELGVVLSTDITVKIPSLLDTLMLYNCGTREVFDVNYTEIIRRNIIRDDIPFICPIDTRSFLFLLVTCKINIERVRCQ